MDAERLAVSGIRRIGIPWSRMRVGVTAHSVYVAPRKRGLKTRGSDPRRRPNLAGLLMGESLLPALQQNESRVASQVGHLLDEVGREWERV